MSLHAYRVAAALRVRGRVEDDDAVGLADLGGDLSGELGDHGLGVPSGLAQEVLDGLAAHASKVRDGLRVLGIEVREEALDVLEGMLFLLGTPERLGEGVDELAEPPAGPVELLGLEPAPGEDLGLADLEAPLHGRRLSAPRPCLRVLSARHHPT